MHTEDALYVADEGTDLGPVLRLDFHGFTVVRGGITATISGGSGGGASYGAYASRPAAGTAGALYIANDAPVALWADSGSAWRPLIGGQAVGTQPPAASTFTLVNAGSSTIADRSGALHVTVPASGASTNLRMFVESQSSTTAYAEAVISLNQARLDGIGFPAGGLVMRESGTTKCYTWQLVNFSSGVLKFEAGIWSNQATRTGVTTWDMPVTNGPLFMKLARDAALIYFYISTDGVTWQTVGSQAIAGVFTTGQDQIGLVGTEWTAGDYVEFDVLHYISGA